MTRFCRVDARGVSDRHTKRISITNSTCNMLFGCRKSDVHFQRIVVCRDWNLAKTSTIWQNFEFRPRRFDLINSETLLAKDSFLFIWNKTMWFHKQQNLFFYRVNQWNRFEFQTYSVTFYGKKEVSIKMHFVTHLTGRSCQFQFW